MKKSNIVLIGFMGTGKTAVGKIISDKLEYLFIDTDEEIEKFCGTTIRQIFEDKGEEYFRKIEAEVVSEVSNLNKAVIACGGGVVKNSDNVKKLNSSGVIVCLKADPEIIYKRVCSDKSRPLASEKSKEEIISLIKEREHLYRVAEFSVDTTYDSEAAIADKIIDFYNTSQ